MKTIERAAVWCVAPLLAGLLAMNAGAATTLQNLQTAYNSEKNTEARYEAFAQKADAERLYHIGSLFRAAARAERIHADNHADVIARMHGRAQAIVESPVVGSTRANLQAALVGESRERDTIYPVFFQQAQREGNKRAMKTFRLAQAVETEHAALYRMAAESMRPAARVAYHVCPQCGRAERVLPEKKCPTCSGKRGKFIDVT